MRLSAGLLTAALCLAQTAPPKLVSKVNPDYSEEARRAGVEAVVAVGLVVGLQGLPEEVLVVKPAGFGLDEHAAEAVRAWRFQPGMKDGQPVRTKATVQVDFHRGDTGQTSRLNFTLPSGAQHPELMMGRVPRRPSYSSYEFSKIQFTVNKGGHPKNFKVLVTTNPVWLEKALDDIREWRFRPASVSGEFVEAEGVLEIQAGQPPAR